VYVTGQFGRYEGQGVEPLLSEEDSEPVATIKVRTYVLHIATAGRNIIKTDPQGKDITTAGRKSLRNEK